MEWTKPENKTNFSESIWSDNLKKSMYSNMIIRFKSTTQLNHYVCGGSCEGLFQFCMHSTAKSILLWSNRQIFYRRKKNV